MLVTLPIPLLVHARLAVVALSLIKIYAGHPDSPPHAMADSAGDREIPKDRSGFRVAIVCVLDEEYDAIAGTLRQGFSEIS